jgi:hypothetical protein
LRTKLQLSGRPALQVWLNGKEVFRNAAGKLPAAPDQASVNVGLRAGLNRLVFKLSYQGAGEVMYARLLDSQRKLKYPDPKK